MIGEDLLTVIKITFCVLNIFSIGLNVMKSMIFFYKTVEGFPFFVKEERGIKKVGSRGNKP